MPSSTGGPPEPESSSGFLIVIEGIDGTGKSTLARALRHELERRGVECLLSREPTDGPHGRRIRALAAQGGNRLEPLEELDLFIKDRRDHVRDVIRPALKAGKAVILDRYYFSTMAYQGARGIDPAEIESRHRNFAPPPDLLVILELDVDRALRRVREVRGDRPDHFESAEYLGRVASIFDSIQNPRPLRLDAEEPTERLVAQILQSCPIIGKRERGPRPE